MPFLKEPSPTASVDLLTFQDAIEHLAFHTQHTKGFGKESRDLKVAVLAAYREMYNARDWKYYLTAGRIVLNAAYSTGSLTYDHTGGSSERLVTLSGGTVPTWAARGVLRVADVDYPIAEYLGTTTFTLDATINPGADIAAGTSYEIYQDSYPLPDDMISVDELQLDDDMWGMKYVEPSRWHGLTKHYSTSGNPRLYTITGNRDAYAGYTVNVWPYPTAAENLDFIYRRTARPLKYDGRLNSTAGDSTKTVSGSSGSTTVSGANTAFASDMVGAVIRFGDTSNHPTGIHGLTPYVEQKIIGSVTNATTLDTTANLDNTHASLTYFSISDPLDLHPTMINAFLRCCEWQLALARDPDTVKRKYEAYRIAFVLAAEADQVLRTPQFGEDSKYVGRGWYSDLAANAE